jgi:outer membrane receptor protein involved in Fe transport
VLLVHSRLVLIGRQLKNSERFEPKLIWFVNYETHFMKQLFSLLIFLVIAVTLSAQQGSISGIITDTNSSEEIPYASLVLLKNNKLTNNGAVSDEKGRFSLINVSYGEYDLLISFIGFKNDTLTNIIVDASNPTLDLGTVSIETADYLLDEVEVTAMANTVSKKIDRQTYRAADFETARGGTAIDLLNKLPSVSVSPDGNVSVRGTTDFMVYMNGKPTQMDPSMLLGQINSDNIENVEVITVPSAKYDAQGKGGIINISTKKSASDGLAVMANILGGGAPWGHKTDRYSSYAMNDYRYNGNINFIYSKEKLNVYGGASYSMKNVNGLRVGDARILDPISGAFKHMVADGERPEWYENISANLGFDLELSANSKLSGSYFFGKRTEGRSAFYIYNVFYADENKQAIAGVPMNDTWIYNPNTDNRYGTFQTANLDYDLKIDDRSDFNLSILYENSGLSRILDNYNYDYNKETDLAGDVMAHFNQTDNTPLTGFRVAAEYQIAFDSDQLLEFGFQPQFFNITGDFSYDTLGIVSNAVADYSSLENSIDLSRNVYAGYVNYSKNWKDLSFMLGLRMEYTDQEMNIENSEYFSIFDRPTRSDYMVQKLDWFPTVHASYSLGEDRLIFAASRRLNRPPIKNMAPFLYRRHYEVYVVGDPSLKPEYSNNLELSYDKKFSKNNVTLTGFYRGVDNAIFRVNTINLEEMVLIRSYTNSGNTQALGAELNSNIQLGAKSKLFLGGSLYNFRVKGDVFGYQENNSSMNWSLKGAYNLNFSKQLKWSTDFDVQSATVTAQGQNEMFYFLNTAFSYSPKNLKDWSFSLKGLDLLSSNVKGLDTRAFDETGVQIFYQETTYFRFGPIAELSISYLFNSQGKKVKKGSSEFGNKEF